MRTITLAYPGFQTLPRGVKKMLVVSESFFFGEHGTPKTPHPQALKDVVWVTADNLVLKPGKKIEVVPKF